MKDEELKILKELHYIRQVEAKIMFNILDIPFMKPCSQKFDEDAEGTKIFTCEEEKEEFDTLEKLSITDLWQKFYPHIPFDISQQLYLRDRGLLEEIGSERSGMDVYPVFGWKDKNSIDWLKKHEPQKSKLIDENYFREGTTLSFDFPPRYSEKSPNE